jgi:alkanesulfonate monooxygenase SsuD/methylene tetrahydromethanopterin reductase-like flavin-dependent oxidoreductase (luciferase family)
VAAQIGREAVADLAILRQPVDSHADVRQVRAGLTPYMQEFALIGTPEQIAEQLAEKALPHGFGGLIVNMPFSGHFPGTLQAIGQALTPLVHA